MYVLIPEHKYMDPVYVIKASANKNAIVISGVLGMIDPRKKFGAESSSEVRKMLGCLNCKYASCVYFVIVATKFLRY